MPALGSGIHGHDIMAYARDNNVSRAEARQVLQKQIGYTGSTTWVAPQSTYRASSPAKITYTFRGQEVTSVKMGTSSSVSIQTALKQTPATQAQVEARLTSAGWKPSVANTKTSANAALGVLTRGNYYLPTASAVNPLLGGASATNTWGYIPASSGSASPILSEIVGGGGGTWVGYSPPTYSGGANADNPNLVPEADTTATASPPIAGDYGFGGGAAEDGDLWSKLIPIGIIIVGAYLVLKK